MLLALLVLAGAVAPEPLDASPRGEARPQSVAPENVTVEIEGVEGEVLENVRSVLELAGASDDDRGAVREDRIRQLHARAGERIRAALEPFGFYRPRIESELEESGGEWRARYRIDPGPPVSIRELDLRLEGEGARDSVLREAVAEFPLEEGDPLRHPAWESGREALATAAAERGYLDARFTSRRVEVDLESYAARITLHLRTGPRHAFGPVEFRGSGIAPDVLQRFVPFEPGDPYGAPELIRLQSNLTDSEYFDRIEVESRPDEARPPPGSSAGAPRVPITVRLEPTPPVRYNAGLGYGTDTGPRGTAGLRLDPVNSAGHRLIAQLRASFIVRELTGRYEIPVGVRGGDRLSFSAGFRDERFEDNESRVLQAGVNLDLVRDGWRQNASLDVRREWFRSGARDGRATLVLPGLGLTRTATDDPIFTTRGSRLLLSLRGTDPMIGSDVAFVQTLVEAKIVRTLYEGGRVIARVDVGATSVSELQRLPVSMRFFAGGDRSVRGYGYQTLAPTDAEGVPTGGRHLLTGSLEFEQRIADRFGAAVFADAGNAFGRLPDGLDLERGVGIGARWRSPVGLVRVDLASAVSRPGRPLRLHVVIGPDL